MTSWRESDGATRGEGRDHDAGEEHALRSRGPEGLPIAERPTRISSADEAARVTPAPRPVGLAETAVSAGPRARSGGPRASVDGLSRTAASDLRPGDEPDLERDSAGRAPAIADDAGLAATAQTGEGRRAWPTPVRAAPGRVGRYLILEELGAGGMGAVYAAYDPELDRKIAIKLLRSGRGGPQERARLIREAQAMAKLAHPHVVAVHDVGEHLGEVFVAMEFVKGATLGGWLARASRSWSEILTIFLQAGEGLRAAHEAGLVHRDFKPDNVLVGADDRARVTDFGLVRADGPAGEGEVPGPMALKLTSVGAVMGTPTYMAPEQFLAAATDARTDQFSFCVALHEALCGELPFEGETFSALRESVTSGRRAATSRRPSAPPWVLAAIDRGLAREPDARWPTMAALLEALRDDPARRRRRGRWIAGALVGAGIIGVGLVVADRRAEARCAAESAAARDRIAAAAPAIEAAILGTGLSFADRTWARTHAGLARWADAWGEVRAETCALERAGDPRAAARDRCLEAALAEFGGALGVLAELDRAGVVAAVDVVSGVPPAIRCRDDRQVDSLYPAEAIADDHSDARARLVRATVLRTAVRTDEAAALVGELLEETAAGGEAPRVRAEALRLDARLRGDAGDPAGELAALQRAYFYAGAIGHDVLTIGIASDLVGAVLDQSGDAERAQLWDDLASMRITRLGLEGTEYEANHLHDLAAVRIYEGRLDEAIALGRRSLALLESIRGADHPSLVDPLYRLSLALDEAGRHEEAAPLVQRALDLVIALKGDEHPSASRLRGAAAVSAYEAGDLAGARALLERAIAGIERSLGPAHPDLVEHLNTLAAVDLASGDRRAALEHLRRALSILDGEADNEGPQALIVLVNVGALTLDLGAPEEAVALERRAVALAERTRGADHPALVSPLTELSRALLRLDRPEEAIAAAARAVELGGRGEAPDVAALVGARRRSRGR
ncbi:MAG: serine/threonine-protein kinase [Nannocystaceae bacterium]